MKLKYSKEKLNKLFYNLCFFIISLIFVTYFVPSLYKVIGGTWAYNELFINYSSGIIRRGFLGAIFLKFNQIYDVNPLFFFSSIFIILQVLKELIDFIVIF